MRIRYLGFFAILLSGLVHSNTLVIKNVTLIDGLGTTPMENATVVINNDIISDISNNPDLIIEQGAEIIDASGKWLMPGLIDAHMHFFQSGGLYTRPDILDLTQVWSYKDKELVQIKQNLTDTFGRYLLSGITSVVDVGGPFWNFDVRKQAETTLLAPRVAVAGPLISTARREILEADDAPIIQAKSADEARRLVDEQAKRNPDLIKIWLLTGKNYPLEKNIAMVEATINQAKKHNIRVAVHATSLDAAKAAVKAGASILVHSISDQLVDQEMITLLLNNQVIYTTTLIVTEGYLEALTNKVDLSNVEIALSNPNTADTLFHLRKLSMKSVATKDDNYREQREKRLSISQQNLKILQNAGVTIAAGTDAGNIGTLHGPAIFREFELMRQAGLSATDIIINATSNAAKVFAPEPKTGSIQVGKLADLLLLNNDPTIDIKNTQAINKVIKGGVVINHEDILRPTPEQVVQRQIVAYNSRNIDAFMATYSDDIQVFRQPDEMLYDGQEAMRARYAKMFEDTPDLYCEIVNRMTIGEFVIDKEQVIKNGKIIHAVAVYHVKGNKIDKVWFMK